MGARGDICVALSAPNLLLEPLTAAHAGELFALLRNDALYTFIPQEPPKSLEWLRERYAKLEARRSPTAAKPG